MECMAGAITALSRVGKVLWVSFRALRALRTPGSDPGQIKLEWASQMLRLTGLSAEVLGVPVSQRPVILIGNHLSYLDIPLLLRSAPQVSFVAKEELKSWPIFGEGMARTGTFFVKRDSAESRGRAMESLRNALALTPKPIAIFPSGTTSLDEKVHWKSGAFRLAGETGIPIQAFRIRYEPCRPAAFVGSDSFLLHLWQVCRLPGIKASIEFAEPELVQDPEQAKGKWSQWCR
jgi:1-acyl-sn-glycerol-3-phosphate acyltransferase